MKTKFIFFLLLPFLYMAEANACLLSNPGVEITLTGNDEPFKGPDEPGKGGRSIPMAVPFAAFLNEDCSIDLDFYQAVGEIEIIISQNGTVVYSSTESIDSPVLKKIPLQEGLSGDFLLEVSGEGGGYVYGKFIIE